MVTLISASESSHYRKKFEPFLFLLLVKQSDLVGYEPRSTKLLLLHVHVDLHVDDVHEDDDLHPDRVHAGWIVSVCSVWVDVGVAQCVSRI